MIQWICKLNNGDTAGEITFYDSSDTTASAKNKLLSGVIKKEVNTAGSFVFEISKSNTYYSKFQLNTVVCVYGIDREHSNQVIGNFLGRVTNIELGFDLVAKITCEDAFGVLDDMVDWTRVQLKLQTSENSLTLIGAMANYINSLMHSFNLNAGVSRTFFRFHESDQAYPIVTSGWESSDLDSYSNHIIAVDNSSEAYDFGWNNEGSCKDSLDDYISSYGGYVVIEPITKTSTTSEIKLFWFPEYLSESSLPDALKESQTLDFGTNILSVSREVDFSDVFTRIYPFGKTAYWTYDATTGTWSEADEKSFTDTTAFEQFPLPYVCTDDDGNYVTPGYIDDEELIEKYGYIEKPVVFDNATTNAKLESKTANYFKKYKRANLNGNVTISVTGVDLATAGQNKTPWHIGRYVQITSEYHGINSKYFMISAIELNMFDASKTKITFNNKPVRLTQKTKNTMTKLKQTTKDNQISTNATTTDLQVQTNENTSAISTKQDSLGTDVTQIVKISASDYEALETKVATTLYLIPEE